MDRGWREVTPPCPSGYPLIMDFAERDNSVVRVELFMLPFDQENPLSNNCWPSYVLPAQQPSTGTHEIRDGPNRGTDVRTCMKSTLGDGKGRGIAWASGPVELSVGRVWLANRRSGDRADKHGEKVGLLMVLSPHFSRLNAVKQADRRECDSHGSWRKRWARLGVGSKFLIRS